MTYQVGDSIKFHTAKGGWANGEIVGIVEGMFGTSVEYVIQPGNKRLADIQIPGSKLKQG